jgi:hypothetical protein
MSVSAAQGGVWLGAVWGGKKTRDSQQRAGFGSIATYRRGHGIRDNWYVVRT